MSERKIKSPLQHVSPDRVAKFWSKVNKAENATNCWLWTGCHNSTGYGLMWVGKHRRLGPSTIKVDLELVHRISWVIHNGPLIDNQNVLHKCDTPDCVNPEHLWIGSHADNMADKMAKGRARPGYGLVKLTEDRVRFIRNLASQISDNDLAWLLNIAESTVLKVRRGQTWKHITC